MRYLKYMNILFTNVGRRNYIIDFVKEIPNINIFLTDCDPTVPCFYYKGVNKHLLPSVNGNSKKYLSKLLNLVKKKRIEKLIPLSDHDLFILSKNRIKFEKLGCHVIISKFDFVRMCLNKKKMHEYCLKKKINTPNSFFQKTDAKLKLPLLKKRIFGSGSVDMEIIKNRSEFKNLNFNKFFLQEKIFGTEYGIDIFNDPEKYFSRICVKKKLIMRAGETDRSLVITDNKIKKFAENLIKIFGHYGNIDCDVIKDKSNKIYLLDINPRFGGGYPATHLSGMNFLKYILTNGKYKPPKNSKEIFISKGISVHKNK